MKQTNLLMTENNPNVRIMLEKLYDTFAKKFNDSIKAWDHFIEFLAIDNSGDMIFQIKHKFEWLFNDKKFRDSIYLIYDSKLLKSDYYDHLGDMYFEKNIGNFNEESLKRIPLKRIKFLIEKKSKKNTQIKVLDKKAGTGRYLMDVYKIAPKALLFGMENNLQVLRIALTNFAIHGIKGFLLHADSQSHDIELNTKNGIYNWKYANKWNSFAYKLKKDNQNFGINIPYKSNKLKNGVYIK